MFAYIIHTFGSERWKDKTKKCTNNWECAKDKGRRLTVTETLCTNQKAIHQKQMYISHHLLVSSVTIYGWFSIFLDGFINSLRSIYCKQEWGRKREIWNQKVFTLTLIIPISLRSIHDFLIVTLQEALKKEISESEISRSRSYRESVWDRRSSAYNA